MAQDVLFDFDNPSDAARSLKRVAQAMQRAGQPVVSHDFDQKLRRTGGINYRQALLTLASGQTVTLQVKQTGDVFRVLLNGAVLPIKNQDGIKAIGEIADAAGRNQKKFQAAQARKKVELPKSIRTAAPKMAEALAQRNTELDAQIAEKTAERDALKAELGPEAVLDAVIEEGGKPDWSTHDWPQIVQNGNGNWFGVKAGWEMRIHQDFKEGDVFSLLSEDGEFLKRTEVIGDWRQSLESRPVLDSVEGEPLIIPDDAISWCGFKLVNQAFVEKHAAMPLPSASPISGSVVIRLSENDSPLDVSGIVVAVKFSASKVLYTVAVPVSPSALVGSDSLYAVLHDIPSETISPPDVALDSTENTQKLLGQLMGNLEPWTTEHEESLQLALSVVDGTALDGVGDVSAAVATLQIALGTVENNAPINEAAGNVEQAALERQNAESFRKALAILDAAGGIVLSDTAIEVLNQIAAGPVEDGDVISKAARDELIEAGFIDRYTDEGDNVINDAGRAFLADIDDEFEPAEGQESLFEEEAA